MYHIYHTEAIVCGSRPRGEADRIVLLFSRDAGLVAAHARSLRREDSRLRYILQSGSRIDVDLVRGKGGWRLTSARPKEPLFLDAIRRPVFFAVTSLLVRLLAHDDSDPKLYDDLSAGFNVAFSPETDATQMRDVELLLVLRLLFSLGYWGDKDIWTQLLPPYPVTGDNIAYVRRERKALLPLVNMAMRETGL